MEGTAKTLILPIFCALVMLLPGLCGSAFAQELELSPFVSDGCSMFPDGPPQNPEKWRDCCYKHDRAYWLGGTYAERLQADDDLRTCIAEVENPALAEAMWAGVRAGGSPFWPTPFRWGYGWPYLRGYQALTEEERQRAEALIASETKPAP